MCGRRLPGKKTKYRQFTKVKCDDRRRYAVLEKDKQSMSASCGFDVNNVNKRFTHVRK